MLKILAILVGVPLGMAIIKYRERVETWTGPVLFAEEKLGSGGTYTLIAIIGVLVVGLSIFYAVGALDILLQSILKFFPFSN